jgi:lactose/L-arabinose transport system permease protein
MRGLLSPVPPPSGVRPTVRPARTAGLIPRGRLRRLWRYRWPLIFVSPFFVLFAIFGVYPIAFSLWLSFRDWSLVGEARNVGLDNFRALLHDDLFWRSMLNSVLLFFIYVPVMTFLAIVLAALLNSHYVRLQGFWRAAIFVPNIMAGTVAAAFTFQLMLDTNSGFANRLLGFVGVSPVPWHDDVWWARISLGLLVFWAWLGFNMLIMLAGLQAIPPELVESARVDGANPVQIFRRITVPLLRPQIIFSVTLSIIGTFQLFTEPYILFNPPGGPARATDTPVLEIQQNTFAFLRVGYGAAMSYVFFAAIVVVTLVQFFLVNRRDPWGQER